MAEMTLREVCLALGVSRRAIQGYENANLVSATNKTESGYLLYNDSARNRIRQIKLYQNMGFTLLYISQAYYCTLRAVNKKQTTLKYHFSVACLFTQLFLTFPKLLLQHLHDLALLHALFQKFSHHIVHIHFPFRLVSFQC